jgi:hypothetical protein
MAALTKVDILRQARELLSDEERWTRGSYARDAEGKVCGWNEPEATCFCAEGAIFRVSGGGSGPAFRAGTAALELLEEAIPGRSGIPKFNDGGKMKRGARPRRAPARHKRVLAAFDRALELAEAA